MTIPHDDSRSDVQLVNAVNEGDIVAFEALYFRHRDWVVSLALRFCGDRDEALDVMQETFAYVLRKIPRLRLTAGIKTFLYPVVKNTAIALRRKRRRMTSDDEVVSAVVAPPGDCSSPAREELAAVVRTLPAEQCETLLMRFVDDMSLDEIAVALHIPVGTVKSRLHTALNTLRLDERTKAYFAK